jgi:hypothetical protein
LSDPATASYLLATIAASTRIVIFLQHTINIKESPVMISGESLNNYQLQWWNYTTVTEQADIAVMLCICTRNVLGSNLGWNTSCSDLRFSVVFLNHSKQMPG